MGRPEFIKVIPVCFFRLRMLGYILIMMPYPVSDTDFLKFFKKRAVKAAVRGVNKGLR